jgi:hypothetical protein
MMTPMPKPFEPMLTHGEPSEDGLVEMELSVNGHFVAVREFDMKVEDWFAAVNGWWRAEIMRRC